MFIVWFKIVFSFYFSLIFDFNNELLNPFLSILAILLLTAHLYMFCFVNFAVRY